MQRNMRGASIARYAEVATELGLDPNAMLRRLDIDSRVLTQTDLRIPSEKIVELLERSAEASGCETFGLRMALSRQLADYGPISLLFAHQPTLRDALRTMMRYQRMLNEALLLHIEEGPDDGEILRQEIVTGAPAPARQAYELAVGTLAIVFGGSIGPKLRAQSVHFSHDAPADLAIHRQVFGQAPVFQSAFNGFVTRRIDLDAPNLMSSPALAAHAENFIRTLPYAEDVSLTVEVQKAIHVLLPFNGASITAVGARLGVSERTLQRRLAEEGGDFTTLLNEVRREYALRYLANQRIPVAEVAGLVGYGHETSFTRWFAAQFGVTPSVWRAAAH